MKIIINIAAVAFLVIGVLRGEEQIRSIKLGAGLSLEPYVLPESDSGFELDIVRESLKYHGYHVSIVYCPLKRTKMVFRKKEVDGVLTIKANFPEVKDVYISEEYNYL